LKLPFQMINDMNARERVTNFNEAIRKTLHGKVKNFLLCL
jgi:hypothetical protein